MASCWWHCRRDRACRAECQRCAGGLGRATAAPQPPWPYLRTPDDLLPAVLQRQPSLVPVLLPGVAVEAELGRQLGQPEGAVGVQPARQLLQLLSLLAESGGQSSWAGGRRGCATDPLTLPVKLGGLEPQGDPSQLCSITAGSSRTPSASHLPAQRSQCQCQSQRSR